MAAIFNKKKVALIHTIERTEALRNKFLYIYIFNSDRQEFIRFLSYSFRLQMFSLIHLYICKHNKIFYKN